MSMSLATAEVAPGGSPATSAAATEACAMDAPVATRRAAPAADGVPGVKDVRANMGEEARQKSSLKGVLFFAVSFVPYVLGFVGFLVLDGWAMKAISAGVIMVAIPMLFVIGHDACHQALTPHRWLNKVIGRVAMTLTWHAYAVWELGHNGMHHAWTNVRGKDFAWVPLSTGEYARLSPLRRFMHRRYRTWWGVGFYYLLEMYTKWGLLTARAPSRRLQAVFLADWFSVAAFTVAHVATVLYLTDRTGLGGNSLLVSAGLLTLGVVVPFLVWNWVMGILILMHHTHPTVPWYGDVDDWSYYAGQVQSTVHIELPRPIELVLHNIMEHTAHHADPRVPLYNLEKAQKNLEHAYGGEIVVVPFSVRGFFNTLRTCRLFDYENHRWLDWDGTPTTEPLLRRREGRLVKA